MSGPQEHRDGDNTGNPQPWEKPEPIPPPSSDVVPHEEVLETPPDSGGWNYYVFHPYGRLFTAVSLTLCNFMLYGEDPIVHAYTEAELPIAGQALGILALNWPDKAGIAFLKILIALVAMLLGLVIGRILVHHMLLRDMFRLKFCGWSYHDVDDIRTTEAYRPWRTLTPYNRMWWGGVKKEDAIGIECPRELEVAREDSAVEKDLKPKLRTAYEKGYERGLASVNAKGVSEMVLGGEAGGGYLDPSPYDYTREEYQEKYQTALELLFPWCFKPRKHHDHSKGSVLVMFGTAMLIMALGAVVYNAAVLTIAYSGDEQDQLTIGPGLGMNEYEFGKFAACLCWLADLLNLVCAFDCTFQEIGQHQERIRDNYRGERDAMDVLKDASYKRPKIAMRIDEDPNVREVAALVQNPTPRLKLGYVRLAPSFSKFWNSTLTSGYEVRMVVIWIFSLTLTILVLVAVAFDTVSWDEWTEEYGFNLRSTELHRLILASIIAIQGPLTVIQDLEWPSFAGENDINLPGMSIDHVSCDWCPSCSLNLRQHDANGNVLPRRSVPFTTFFITNKWITFIPFVLSLVLDYSMLFACWEYHPSIYGQYVNPESNEICTTRNHTYANEIKEAWEVEKVLLANYTERLDEGYLDEVNGTDFCMPSRYVGTDSSVKFWVAIPGALMYAFFIYYLIKWTRIEMKVRAWEHPDDAQHLRAATTEAFLVSPATAATAPPPPPAEGAPPAQQGGASALDAPAAEGAGFDLPGTAPNA